MWPEIAGFRGFTGLVSARPAVWVTHVATRGKLTGSGERGRNAGYMRLTGGLDRGRRLFVPRGSRTRPTASKVREAIFNILGPPPGAVLDLYAGSGALGLEALSRGAASAVFVERDGNVRSALRKLAGGDERFSWVFLDPPYVKDIAGVLAELSGALLTPCAVVIVE